MHNYSYNVVWSEQDNCYIATSPEFQRVSAFGDTPQEALNELSIVMEGVIETYEEEGWPLPEPRKKQKYSGQFRVRLPKSLHQQLAEKADIEEVSLNTLVVQYLSASVAEANSRSNRHQDITVIRIHSDKAKISSRPALAQGLPAEAHVYTPPAQEHYYYIVNQSTPPLANLLPVSQTYG